jgi:WhiB family transcriptional regulator, redox-sensing transcriptional regulator
MTASLADTAHETWMTEGACHGEDPDLFFPISASDAGIDQIRQATSICDHCRVESDCLLYALNNRIKDGIWGGLTEQQRQSLIRSRRRRRLKLGPGRPVNASNGRR